jgi:hypothetical protein
MVWSQQEIRTLINIRKSTNQVNILSCTTNKIIKKINKYDYYFVVIPEYTWTFEMYILE